MEIVLIRHAHAVPMEEDASRPLSMRGRDDARHFTNFFSRNRALAGFSTAWHSPLARARETAQLVLPALASDSVLIETPGLQPEDDVEEIARRIDQLPTNVVIVGHEPHLSALTTLLVRGKTGPA